jgi:nondiscriminating glutamyl-tRNA synthetase
MTIRTRFAPSPTGYLHIGGVRTALFNWLLTRRLGGQFVLRIDDTDAERNRPEALQPILDGFRWLGIDWDEGPEVGGPHAPYFQSQRGELYRAAALKLLDGGHAYPDYTSKEELDAARTAAERAKQNFVYRGANRDLDPAKARGLYEGRPALLRLKVPAGRPVVIDDAIRGRVEWQTGLIGDPVILRDNGTPLYNFATAVDDTAMGITHVIRAAEHLSNTSVQALIFEAMGAKAPVFLFAHVPVVNEPNSKKKLSKREMKKFVTAEVRAKLHSVGWTDEQIDTRDDLNPATVAYYRELGYLPAALVNYLGRLGWSLDDRTEYLELPDMIANFSLDRVNNAPASFDPAKLEWLAGEYMKKLPQAGKVAGVLPFLRRAGLIGESPDGATLRTVEQVVAACGDRLKIFSDVLQYAAFFFKKDPEYDAAALKKRVGKEGVPALLREFMGEMAKLEPFAHQRIEEALKAFCDARVVKGGDMIHALRVGATGVTIGPGIFECLEILGRDESLRRLNLALEQV